MASWFNERRKQGNARIAYYFVAIGSPDSIYLTSDAQKGTIKFLAEIHNEQRLVPMIEKQYSKGLTKSFQKTPRDLIKSIRTIAHGIEITLTDGEVRVYGLNENNANTEEVAATIANYAMPGVFGTRVTELNEKGVVRKKTVARESLVFDRSS